MHRSTALASALLLTACAEITPCPEGPEPEDLAACLAPTGGWDANQPLNEQPLERTVSGDVIEVLTASPTDGCFVDGAHVGAFEPSSPQVFLRIGEPEGGEWIVGLAAGGLAPELLPVLGDAVEVDYSFLFGGFGPNRGQLTIRSTEGDLLAYVGHGAGAQSIPKPEWLTLTRGEARCSESSDCGAWSEYHLVVSHDEAMFDDPTVVLYGGTAELDRWTVHHGGYEEQTSESGTCADWFVADLKVALLPTL